MTIFNNLIDNNYIIYGLVITTTGLISYLVIKSFSSSIIETPNSPQKFNFTLDQLKECQDILDNKGESETPNLSLELNKEVQDILDNEGELDDSLKQILTEEEYKQYKEELLHPENDVFSKSSRYI